MHSRPELSGTVLSGHPVFSSQLAAKYGICFPLSHCNFHLYQAVVVALCCLSPVLNLHLMRNCSNKTKNNLSNKI